MDSELDQAIRRIILEEQSIVMKLSLRQINIVPVIGLGLATAAFSLSVSNIQFNPPTNYGKPVVLSSVPNICATEAAEQNPRPFLFVGCGIE